MSLVYSTAQDDLADQELDSASIGTVSTKRTNALSHKLTNVLSTSYADTEIRDALRLLDIRGATNAEHTRKNLRYDAQEEVVSANAKIVDDFAKVAKQLKRVGALIETLNQTCNDMRIQIIAAKRETAPMLEEASTLLARKKAAETKQELLDAFCKHFLISDEDLTTLTSSAEPVNERFFVILSRVKQIHKDCEILLGYENQRLGLELMEQTNRNLDAGYKKLYNWIQREFRGLDLEDPQISGSIRRSLRALSERPSLFQNCLDFFAEARQATLSEAFQRALTDSTLGAAKAIDFSTHDPLRYMGDMLAWVHSATVSEMEALEGLFISDADEISRGLTAGKNSDPWARVRHPSKGELETFESEADGEERFDGHAALNSLISRNMATVAQTLTQRISLNVRNLSDPVSIYKAFNVLCFYDDMFMKLLGHATMSKTEGNVLINTLETLQTSSQDHFERAVTEELQSSIDDEPNPDQSPPTALRTILSQFTQIIHIRGPNLDAKEFIRLYNVLLKPVLDSCAELADSFPESTSETINTSNIYRLNYLFLVRDTLSGLVSSVVPAREPLTALEHNINSLRNDLTDDLARSFAHTSGLQQLSSGLERAADRFTSLQTSKQFRKYILTTIPLEDLAQNLDTFLAHALMDTQEVLGQLADKQLAKVVLSGAVAEFIKMFDGVVDRLAQIDEEWLQQKDDKEAVDEAADVTTGNERKEDEEAGEEDDLLLRELYPRTVGEVEALLS